VNKTELIKIVAAKTSLPKEQAGKAVNEILASITQALTKGQEVKINDFGAFGVTDKKERKGRNPQTGEEITIPASKVPQFKAAKVLKDILNEKSFIEKFTATGKLNEEEARVLTYVFEESRKAKTEGGDTKEAAIVEVKKIAEDLGIDFKETEMIASRLIGKKILNTKVFTSRIEEVFLRGNYRKYL
jgi:nucleoid DNA-binding protein